MGVELLNNRREARDRDQSLENRVSALEGYLALLVKSGDIANGAITAPKILDGAVEELKIAAGAVTAAKTAVAGIDSSTGNVTANHIIANMIQTNAVIASKIQAGAVTADKITVSTLSAISANVGTLTSGTIRGVLIETAANGKRVRLISNELRSYDSNGKLRWHTDGEYTKWLDNNEDEMARSYGWKTGDSYVYSINVANGAAYPCNLELYGGPNDRYANLNSRLNCASSIRVTTSGGALKIASSTGGDMELNSYGVSAQFNKHFIPDTNNTRNLGSNGSRWAYLYTNQICLNGVCRTSWPSGGVTDHDSLTGVSSNDHHNYLSNGYAITPASVTVTSWIKLGNNDPIYWNGTSYYLKHDGTVFKINDDLQPIADGSKRLGYTNMAWYAVHSDNYLGCNLPTSNSGIGVFKKIKKPKLKIGKAKGFHAGDRHYFNIDEFPDEMKMTDKDSGEKDIELTRTIGVTVSAVKELIEEMDLLKIKILKLEEVI